MNVVEEPIFTRRNALLTAYPSESMTPESGYIISVTRVTLVQKTANMEQIKENNRTMHE